MNWLLLNYLMPSLFYELEIEGLGGKFKHEIQTSIKRISKYPEAWSIERNGIRRYIMHKFPYKIIYSIEKEHIYILALAHLHRKPHYWIDRV